MASSTSIVPACIWRALENHYSEPNPRSSLLYYSPELCSSHKTGYHAFQEIGTHGCLDLYHGYCTNAQGMMIKGCFWQQSFFRISHSWSSESQKLKQWILQPLALFKLKFKATSGFVTSIKQTGELITNNPINLKRDRQKGWNFSTFTLSHILYPREVFHLAIRAARQPNNGPAVVLLIIFMRKLSFND